jgi:phosphoserine phosphatase
LRDSVDLVVFDLDGTLTKVDSTWQYLHMRLGTWSTGRLSAQDYSKGKIDYVDWARQDSSMWRGVELTKLISIIKEIPYVDGAKETISRLRQDGKLSGIVSAGISLLSDRACEYLGMDFAIANELHVSRGRMTGEVTVKVSLNEKGQVIKNIAKQLGVPLSRCAVVGDNSFDLPNEAGLRIAFNPKRDAQNACDIIVRGSDLRAILAYIP